jgi:hypothetical protein
LLWPVGQRLRALRQFGFNEHDDAMNIRRTKVDFDVVRAVGLTLPEVEACGIHEALALKVRGKLLACAAIHRSAEPNTLAVRIDVDQRAELVAAAPRVYYVTDHYVNYPTVLVRLSEIDRNALKDLLGMAWRFVTSKTKPRTRRAQNSRT